MRTLASGTDLFTIFWVVVGGIIALVTIGLGAAGLLAQQRNKALVDAMQVELALSDRKRGELEKELENQRAISRHQEHRINDLTEMVTQAAKVDHLRTVVETGFTNVLSRLPQAV